MCIPVVARELFSPRIISLKTADLLIGHCHIYIYIYILCACVCEIKLAEYNAAYRSESLVDQHLRTRRENVSDALSDRPSERRSFSHDGELYVCYIAYTVSE